ncbi:MAG: hypothetical protein ACR2PT_03235 [Endozoicomonas sp.]
MASLEFDKSNPNSFIHRDPELHGGKRRVSLTGYTHHHNVLGYATRPVQTSPQTAERVNYDHEIQVQIQSVRVIRNYHSDLPDDKGRFAYLITTSDGRTFLKFLFGLFQSYQIVEPKEIPKMRDQGKACGMTTAMGIATMSLGSDLGIAAPCVSITGYLEQSEEYNKVTGEPSVLSMGPPSWIWVTIEINDLSQVYLVNQKQWVISQLGDFYYKEVERADFPLE